MSATRQLYLLHGRRKFRTALTAYCPTTNKRFKRARMIVDARDEAGQAARSSPRVPDANIGRGTGFMPKRRRTRRAGFGRPLPGT
ncbi:hypothetical protein SBBP2_1040021 [Burkholderiales bacterium]|nr:hypothetical protein SBBP2_1040021 [Burkholderiales bacterium]